MKVQQNGHKFHAAIQSQKSENSKNSINFFSLSQLQYKLCGLINDCFHVTCHSHAEVIIVIRYMLCKILASVSFLRKDFFP